MNALQLRVLACLCMLIDHIGYIWGGSAFRAVGRLAFPLFVFLIYNGYIHTSSRLRYALRLGLFALISQIPFALFLRYDSFWANGNVFLTLLLALLCLWATDEMRNRKILRFFCWLPAVVVFALYFFGYLSSDYGAKGILLILVFYFVGRETLWGKILTVLGMLFAIYYPQFLSLGMSILRGNPVLPEMTWWSWMQMWSLLAAPVIFLYNGQKGPALRHPKAVQYGFYLFYPAHQLILWALQKWI